MFRGSEDTRVPENCESDRSLSVDILNAWAFYGNPTVRPSEGGIEWTVWNRSDGDILCKAMRDRCKVQK